MRLCYYCAGRVSASIVVNGKPSCRRHNENSLTSPVAKLAIPFEVDVLPVGHITLDRLETFFRTFADLGGTGTLTIAGSSAYVVLVEEPEVFATKDIDIIEYSGMDKELMEKALAATGIDIFIDDSIHGAAPSLNGVKMDSRFYGVGKTLCVQVPEPGWLFYAKVKAWRTDDQKQCIHLWEKFEWNLDEVFHFVERFEKASDGGIADFYKKRIVFLAQRKSLVFDDELSSYPVYSREDVKDRF